MAAGGHVAFVVPGSIDARTGGYGYDRAIVAGLERRGWSVQLLELPGDFPFPSPESRAAAVRALASLPGGTRVIVDGLAFGALPDEAMREADRLRLIALVHHPLADETGLAADQRVALEAREGRARRAAKHVVVTSARTAAALERFGVPPASITVIEPGTDRAALARGSRRSGAPDVRLLCVATVVPRKGHDILVRALTSMASAAWRLTCVGGLDRDDAWVASVRAAVTAAGLDDSITFAGELDGAPLEAQYDAADVFVLPTWYEGYGMAVAEALARGLPVVSTATGAIAELVGPDAGILVPPGDAGALAAALSIVVSSDACREQLAEGAARARSRLPSWAVAAERMARTIEHVDG